MSSMTAEQVYWQSLAAGMQQHGAREFARAYWQELAKSLERENIPARVVGVALQATYYAAAPLLPSPIEPEEEPPTEEALLAKSCVVLCSTVIDLAEVGRRLGYDHDQFANLLMGAANELIGERE